MAISAVQKTEIDDIRGQSAPTLRPVVPALEEILYKPIPVLDHGFIRVVDYMGDDSAIVQAARVSYGKGTQKTREDRGLIRYLLRHWHTTPFEMCEIKLHIKLPIFIARQWIRHRTANVNEYSARYSVMDREFYIPDAENMAAQSQTNNQGRGNVLSGQEAQRALEILKVNAARSFDEYLELMNEDENGNKVCDEKQGLARELARMNLPVNVYTQWYWKVDLHNFMRFIRLRADDHAQYEIQAYAKAMLDILERWVPHTAEAFNDYQVGGCHLSSPALVTVKKMLQGQKVTQEDSGMNPREWRELMASLEMEA